MGGFLVESQPRNLGDMMKCKVIQSGFDAPGSCRGTHGTRLGFLRPISELLDVIWVAAAEKTNDKPNKPNK